MGENNGDLYSKFKGSRTVRLYGPLFNSCLEKQTIIDHWDNELFVHYSSHDLNTELKVS